MKIIQPPAINNLEELLDVVLHPDKLKKALKQLADMKAAIVESIGVYETKAKADDYLSQAQVQANGVVEQAKALSAKSQEEAKLLAKAMENFAKDQDAWKKAKEMEQASFIAMKRDLLAQADRLKQQEEAVIVREQQVQRNQADLAKQMTKLNAEVEKMNQRKALLNAI
jgi:hypothetical protein